MKTWCEAGSCNKGAEWEIFSFVCDELVKITYVCADHRAALRKKHRFINRSPTDYRK